MFYSLSSIKKPQRQFNLLHLESNELYFLSMKVSLIIDLKYEEYNYNILFKLNKFIIYGNYLFLNK